MSGKPARADPAPGEARPLAARIYARVVDTILRGDFGPQGRLPTESELAATFGVSRPTMREALARLRSDGVIASRRGAGSFVVRMPAAPVPVLTPIRSLADVDRYYVFRACVESGAAAQGAQERTTEDIAALQAAFDALNAKEEQGVPAVEEDVQFHLAIARCSHNQFFVTAIETSVVPIRQFMELAHNELDTRKAARALETRAEHQAIVEAIVHRSAQDAAEATRLHIASARRRIFEATRAPG